MQTYHSYQIQRIFLQSDSNTLTNEQLLEVLQARHTPTIAQAYVVVFQEILKRFGGSSIAEAPLKKGVHLAYVGKGSFKVRDLKARLAEQGVVLSRKITATTTHVLIAPKLKDLEPLRGKTLLLDADVQAFLDATEQPYLQQADYAEEHLASLLLAQDEDQQLVAAGLLEGGGFVPALLPHVFMVSKTTHNKMLRKQLNTYLKRYLHPQSQGAVRKTARLSSTSENMVRKNLVKYAKLLNQAPKGEPGAIQGLEVGHLLFAHRKMGFTYLFDKEKDPQKLLPVLRHFITPEGCLDLAQSYLKKLPEAVNSLSEITAMDLSGNNLNSLPKDLSGLTQLKTLILTYTWLNQLAPLATLPQLETLHYKNPLIYDTQLRYLRKVKTLYLLSQQTVCAERVDGIDYLEPEESKELLATALPHTEIIWE